MTTLLRVSEQVLGFEAFFEDTTEGLLDATDCISDRVMAFLLEGNYPWYEDLETLWIERVTPGQDPVGITDLVDIIGDNELRKDASKAIRDYEHIHMLPNLFQINDTDYKDYQECHCTDGTDTETSDS